MSKFLVTFALGLLAKFVLSNVHVGESNYINVEVVNWGFDVRLTGKKLVHNTVTSDGVSIQIDHIYSEIIKPGDSIVLEVRKRLLFLPDVYYFHEKK